MNFLSIVLDIFYTLFKLAACLLASFFILLKTSEWFNMSKDAMEKEIVGLIVLSLIVTFSKPNNYVKHKKDIE